MRRLEEVVAQGALSFTVPGARGISSGRPEQAVARNVILDASNDNAAK